MTVNGEIEVCRRWWHDREQGSVAPADAIVDRTGAGITPGVVELGARVNLRASSFREAAAVLERTAQVKLSYEQVRKEVEAVGRQVLAGQEKDAIAVTWHSEDCVLPGGENPEKTRVYTGCDGVMVPVITEAEKVKRREKVKAKRRRRGKKCKPLPPRKRGFVSTRQEMIRYPAFQERGWQIGSGPTESQCKLCTKRLKGYGRRWDRPNATAVAALDTLHRNAQWHQVWPNALATAT